MKSQPMVSVTAKELILRIPWKALELSQGGVIQRKRRLTVQDVLELVEAGRLAHRLGKTRSVRSLQELFS